MGVATRGPTDRGALVASPSVLLFILLVLSPATYAGVTQWDALIREGSAQHERGNYEEAARNFAAALKEAEGFGEGDPRLSLTLNNLGVHHLSQSNYVEAERHLKRSLAIRKKVLAADHPEVASSLNNLAMLYGAQSKFAEAEPLLKDAVEIWEKTLGAEHAQIATSLNNLALICSAQGKYAEAESLLKRSVTISAKLRHATILAMSLENLSNLYTRIGSSKEASQAAQQAVRARELARDQPKRSEYVVRKLPW